MESVTSDLRRWNIEKLRATRSSENTSPPPLLSLLMYACRSLETPLFWELSFSGSTSIPASLIIIRYILHTIFLPTGRLKVFLEWCFAFKIPRAFSLCLVRLLTPGVLIDDINYKHFAALFRGRGFRSSISSRVLLDLQAASRARRLWNSSGNPLHPPVHILATNKSRHCAATCSSAEWSWSHPS